MNTPEIEAMMSQYVDLCVIKDRMLVTPTEAEDRAGIFLVAGAKCINWKNSYSELFHEAKARLNVAYKLSLARANVKTMAEKQIVAAADPEYVDALVKKDNLEATVEYFQTYYQLFTNAHIFYRQMCSQIHKEYHNGI